MSQPALGSMVGNTVGILSSVMRHCVYIRKRASFVRFDDEEHGRMNKDNDW